MISPPADASDPQPIGRSAEGGLRRFDAGVNFKSPLSERASRRGSWPSSALQLLFFVSALQ
jgi:hypothetical protein